MFTKRLKALRLEAGLTQKEIALQLNMTQPQYARTENGGRKPSSETLEKFAKFFNVSTDYLLGNTENKNSNKVDLSEVEILYRKTSQKLNEKEKKEFEEDLKRIIAERNRLLEQYQKEGRHE